MSFRLYFYLAFFLFFVPTNIEGQTSIYLKNPSFEKTYKYSDTPIDWLNCADSDTPISNVQPGYYRVTNSPSHGRHYIALTVKKDGSWESIGQRLSEPLKADQCYRFNIALAHSPTYNNAKKARQQGIDFDKPCKLQIWGATRFCKWQQLLATSPVIKSQDWQYHTFTFQPLQDYNYISLEAYFEKSNDTPYNGNLLIDDASGIVPIDCSEMLREMEVDTIIFLGGKKTEDIYLNQPLEKNNEATTSPILTESNSNNNSDDENFFSPTNIAIKNPSFEPIEAQLWHWSTCDDITAIDHASPFEEDQSIFQTAHEGEDFLGLTVDDNNTYGTVKQALESYLLQGECYEMSFYATRSPLYLAESIYIDNETHFGEPAKLRIWGNLDCDQQELLAETPLIEHTTWEQYNLLLQPTATYTHLTIEAFYKTPFQFYYNGNVMVDAIDSIRLISCDSLLFYKEKIKVAAKDRAANMEVDKRKERWKSESYDPRSKDVKSYTYSYEDAGVSIIQNLEDLLNKNYPYYQLQFNIFGPSKKKARQQEDLLIRKLESVDFPEDWYKTKIYVE